MPVIEVLIALGFVIVGGLLLSALLTVAVVLYLLHRAKGTMKP